VLTTAGSSLQLGALVEAGDVAGAWQYPGSAAGAGLCFPQGQALPGAHPGSAGRSPQGTRRRTGAPSATTPDLARAWGGRAEGSGAEGKL